MFDPTDVTSRSYLVRGFETSGCEENGAEETAKTMSEFGELKRLDLRSIWRHEARNCTMKLLCSAVLLFVVLALVACAPAAEEAVVEENRGALEKSLRLIRSVLGRGPHGPGTGEER